MQQKDESNETPDAFAISHSHSVAVAADFKINKSIKKHSSLSKITYFKYPKYTILLTDNL